MIINFKGYMFAVAELTEQHISITFATDGLKATVIFSLQRILI